MQKVLSISILIFFALQGMAQNVGIGTTTPTEKLEVNGVIKSTNSGYTV